MFQGRIITVLLDTAGLPDGGPPSGRWCSTQGAWPFWHWMRRTTWRWCGSTAIRSTVCCWSCPPASWTRGEDHRPAALRELSEETGLEAGELTYLGHIYASPGFCDEALHMYLARDLTRARQHWTRTSFWMW